MYLKGRHILAEFQDRILLEVAERARDAGPRGVVIFDLDSTLLDNRGRQARIVREFGAARDLPRLREMGPEHIVSWSLTEALCVLGLDEAEAKELAPEVRSFWLERFFTSEYCAGDEPLPGATEYLARLVATGCQIAYCTGRHLDMGEGTVASFRRAGFPLPDGERVHLLLKPEFQIRDDDWKQMATAQLSALGEAVAAFDNEPAHVNIYATAYPAARAVHLATDDSGRPIPLAPGVVSVAHFVISSAAAGQRAPASQGEDR